MSAGGTGDGDADHHPLRIGPQARVVRVGGADEVTSAVEALGLRRGRPTLVVVGGAASLSDPDALRPVFAETVVPIAERVGACVVDGGTAAGVMRLLGEARLAAGAMFPLIGVAAEGTVALPGAQDCGERAPLDPNHSHFMLVPGSEWGDEVPWLVRVAGVLADGARSATVLVEGGEVAWRDVAASVGAERRVVVLAGSGRTADDLVAALDGHGAGDRRAVQLADSGLILAAGPDELERMLVRLLEGPS